ncbi:NAD-dependent epimerase/dehydratase family protein [Halocatena salina]|uniref:NAD-dependent epimerase/dehydratase family protein n=1 Tax=Halocatena salina TaxID=2934340 RepID=A0A8U0A017_9EURY|nr:NAD-dependent epimerase/dehydratase family protein [Halocatena salina]UPM42430.1 NAD-dependent epimerase/dehydratase family protein [Halocatena salina]
MRVAVLGCGYVGLELCRQLQAGYQRDVISLPRQPTDHDVIGVRRSQQGIEAIEATGAQAVQADVTDADALTAVPDVDALVFSASSGGRDADAARSVYVEGLKTVIEHFSAREHPPEQLVYTSSTGVYGDHDGGWVDEATPTEPTTEKTRVLANAERVAREYAAEHGIDGTVVRFAGLYGPDRYRLNRYLDGPVTEGYLNMIHRADAAGIVRFALTEGTPETLLAVDDEPVDKWASSAWLADQCGVEQPPTQTKAERLADEDLSTPAKRRIETSKRCSNDLVRELGYEFAYPTYQEGYQNAIERYRDEN